MHTINPRYTQARRRADRLATQLTQPHLTYPAFARRGTAPRVEIGCLRDPALPIELTAAIHTPPRKKIDAEFWATLGTCVGAVWVITSLLAGGY